MLWYLKGDTQKYLERKHFVNTVTAHANELGYIPLYDNSSLYFKLFCNAFIRGRYEQCGVVPVLPKIDATNTGLEYLNIDDTVDDLSRYAEFIVFFDKNHHRLRTLLEIAGYSGLYFSSPSGSRVAPWNGLRFAAIEIVFFAHENIEHEARDLPANAIWRDTFLLADYLSEWQDCQRGLFLAIELMFGQAVRSHRVDAKISNTELRYFRDPSNAIVRGRTLDQDRSADWPAPPPTYRMQRKINQSKPPSNRRRRRDVEEFPRGQDPNLPNYVGDINNKDEHDSYNRSEWAYTYMDAYFQTSWSSYNRARGTNWAYRFSGIKPPQTMPRIFVDLQDLDMIQFMKMGLLGFALIQAAASSVLASWGVNGYILDRYMRSEKTFIFENIFNTLTRGNGDQPAVLFKSVLSALGDMTGRPMQLAHISRDWNGWHSHRGKKSAPWPDKYGPYHYMSGYLPLRMSSMLCVDNFIKARPREWGILKPLQKCDSKDAVAIPWEYDESDAISVFTGGRTADWEKRSPESEQRSTMVTYAPLLLNAVYQMRYRDRMDGLVFGYCHGYHGGSRTRLPDEHSPAATMINDLGTIEPLTLMVFDWTRGWFVEPFLTARGCARMSVCSTINLEWTGICLSPGTPEWVKVALPRTRLDRWAIQPWMELAEDDSDE